MYTATINNKTFKAGKLTVEITFSNGNENITETIDTNQAQNNSWVTDFIKRRLQDLNSLSDLNYSITCGDVNIEDITVSGIKLYQTKAAQYMKYMDAARSGIIRSDRPIILELREWLINNFKDEYISVF